MALENFSTYTEVDANAKLTVTATKADGVNVDGDEDVYLYKDFGANYFDGLAIEFEIYINTACEVASRSGMAVTNTVGSGPDLATTDILVFLYEDGTGAKWEAFLCRGDLVASDASTISPDTLYYCTLSRTAGSNTVTLKIYTDAARTALHDTLSVIGYSTTKYRYLYGFINYNNAVGGHDFDGYVQNMEVDLAPTAPTSLECEGATNPLNVTDTTPEFTAIGNDPDTGDTLTHASIEVDDDSGFGSPIWQSGWIDIPDFTEGNRCAAISYAGGALMAGIKYWWRIKFKDTGGLEGAWSDGTAYFYLHSYGGGAVTFQDPGIL